MKKIHTLKKEKEILAMNYEEEEEYLTNDLSKKLFQVGKSQIVFSNFYLLLISKLQQTKKFHYVFNVSGLILVFS